MGQVLQINVLLVCVDRDGESVPNLSQGHLVHGQRASFIRTDVVSAAHGLAGVHFAHKIVISQHLLH